MVNWALKIVYWSIYEGERVGEVKAKGWARIQEKVGAGEENLDE
jgi:hypothetical protein